MGSMAFGLEDKVVVVTGGSRGIGLELAGNFLSGQTIMVDGGASVI